MNQTTNRFFQGPPEWSQEPTLGTTGLEAASLYVSTGFRKPQDLSLLDDFSKRFTFIIRVFFINLL